MLRLARYSTALLLLVPLNATSLGLGDIQLRSALNEPLDARIGLNALGQTRVDDISVELASRDAFGQVGLERPHFLSDLHFSVEADEQGRPAILVTSSQPISEPFLDFLVELNWPNGRLLREYTVLLDPPLLVDEAPEPIMAATSAGAGVAGASVPATASAARASSGPAVPMTGARAQIAADGAWNYGPVARDATLWSIAQELQALGGGYSIEQIMMALLRDNAEAFYNGNVNELKAGHVLRIEDPSTISAISRAAAIAEYRRQSEQWMDAKRGVAGQVADRPMGADSTAQADAAGAAPVADAGPRLRLSAPEAMDAENLIGGTNEGEAEGSEAQRLRQELAVALEVSEVARQENVELRERLAALEEQITSMQRLLSLREDALTAMQTNAGAASASGEAGANKSNPWTALLNDPMMLAAGGGGLLLFVILGWLIARRRQAARAAIEEFAAQPAPRVRDEASATTVATATAVAGGSAAVAGLAVEEELVDEEAEAALAGAAGADIMQADEDEIDVLAEADVYLAYRRFDKAEELLRQAIQEDPQRNDLVLKLLEVHAASGNADAFALQAEALQASLGEADTGIWDKVVVMGRRVAPGHALFAGGTHHAARTDSTGVGELDLDNLDFTQFDEAAAAMSAEDEAQNPFIAAGDDVDAVDASMDVAMADPSSFDAADDMTAESAQVAGDSASDRPTDTGIAAGIDTGADEFPLESGMGEPTVIEPAVIDEARPGTLGDFAAMPASANEASGLEETADAEEATGGMDIDWLSAVGDDLANLEVDLLAEDEDEYDGLVSGTDEVGTKLDLAKAYIDMGDQESALSILDEVGGDGSEDQQREVSALRSQIG